MIPETVQPAQKQEFEQLMESLTMMQHQEPTPNVTEEARVVPVPEVAEGEERETTSTKISKGIMFGKIHLLQCEWS